MTGMFAGTETFNSPLVHGMFSQVDSMESMFNSAAASSQRFGQWGVRNVTRVNAMLHMAFSFSQPVGDWIVSRATDMSHLFYKATLFSQSIGQWNFSNVANMEYMLFDLKSFKQSLRQWNVYNLTGMQGMSTIAKSLNSYNIEAMDLEAQRAILILSEGRWLDGSFITICIVEIEGEQVRSDG